MILTFTVQPLGIGYWFTTVKLLMRYTTYILKLAGWLDVGIRRTVKG